MENNEEWELIIWTRDIYAIKHSTCPFIWPTLDSWKTINTIPVLSRTNNKCEGCEKEVPKELQFQLKLLNEK